ncbi:uncharacterized protein [Venturia canescens]|uniref:uncharacterized protein n=1 Tax=Venturia canescens TaxID=32260 RepID=UPI001C9C6000|nr:uncharacterized protein LOC122410264 [Venturia canescens]
MSLVYVLSIAFCAINLVTVHAEDVALPSSVKTCKKDSDDYSSCLRLALQESWPIFVQGIPELGVPSLEPFVVEFQSGNYKVGEVSGQIVTKNIRSYGLAKTRFLSVKPQHDTKGRFSLEIDSEMSKVFVEGDYKAEGAVGSFRVGGKGHFNISMEDVRSVWEIEGPVVNDKWIIETFRLTPDVGKMKIWASDLFNGNEELTKAALAFANEYWPVFYRDMLPYAAETWNPYLRDLVGNIFSKLSFSKTFP